MDEDEDMRKDGAGEAGKAATPGEDPAGATPGEAPAAGREGSPAAGRALSRRGLVVGAGVLALAVLGAACAAVSSCSRTTERVSSVAPDVSDAGGQAAQAAIDAGREAARALDEPLGVVCVDPGHGAIADLSLTPVGPGSDETQYVEPGGATGVATGVPEYEVALEVGLLLRDALASRGVSVVMTRETNDVVLSSEQRAQVANEAGADLFVRLHCDGEEDASLAGFSTLVPGQNEWTGPIYESSLHAAEVMHPLIVDAIGATDRGIVERPDLAGFNFCEVPSVLFEMGFLSNPDEDVLLNDPSYQQLLAGAIADAACVYLQDVKG